MNRVYDSIQTYTREPRTNQPETPKKPQDLIKGITRSKGGCGRTQKLSSRVQPVSRKGREEMLPKIIRSDGLRTLKWTGKVEDFRPSRLLVSAPHPKYPTSSHPFSFHINAVRPSALSPPMILSVNASHETISLILPRTASESISPVGA